VKLTLVAIGIKNLSIINMNAEIKMTVPWKLVIIFLCFSAAIILSGVLFYKSQRRRIFIQNEKELTAIASLKVGQIEQWRKERFGVAAVIRDNEPLINRIKQYYRDENQSEIKTELTKWLESLCREYDFGGALLIDTTLKVRLSLFPSDTVAGDSIIGGIKAVMKNCTLLLTDLHKTNCLSYVHLDMVIPLIKGMNKNRKPFGVLILRIDPRKNLYPIIQSWPIPSKSSETLLLRKDGDSVLYLNELRHRRNTALNLRLPASDKHLLGSMAVNGQKGLYEGIDYRNIPVIGYLTGIPGTSWFMVAKTDKEEILVPMRRYLILSVIIILLLILINASVFIFWIWNQRVRSYRMQLLNEITIRESQKKLIDSEERYRNIFNALIEGFCMIEMVYDPENKPVDYRFLEVNSAFEKQSGLHDVKGKLMRELVPDIEEYWFEIFGKVALTGEQVQFENEARALNKWFEVRASRLEDPESKKVVIYFNDITHRKLGEILLRESEDKFKYIFDHSVVGKSITLPTGELHVNKTFCDMLGYSIEELEKTNLQDITHPEDNELTLKVINSLLSGEKEAVRFIKRYLHKNGSIVWADVGTALRRDDKGNPLYFMTAVNNITDRIRAEEALHILNEELEQRVTQRTEQLQAANKELEAFSYSVSHDLRAPLRAINSYTNILIEEYENKLDEEGKRLCGIISSGAMQMGGLIDDLLSFSRIGRSTLNLSLIDMNKMVRIIMKEMISPNETDKIKIHIGRLQKTYGDIPLFGQVWKNLISNAIKYSSKNARPEISIGSQVKENTIIYHIKDNGVGFDMQYTHKLFGVFQRLHSESEFEGNGVGLAIVQRIVVKHGGLVWAKGEVGKGAVFYFSLPLQN
jgi:PAS domain S-box-containing protein